MARDFHRRRATRPEGRLVIISCEGKSERGYFDDLRMFLRLPKERVSVILSKHTDPLTVVTTAIDERENRAEDWNEDEDQSWAVFDGDRADKEQENWNSALQLAEEKQVVVAVSNPCIELWYLFHFQDQFAYISTDDALRQMKKCIPGYEKADRPFKSHLQPLTSQAIQRAKLTRRRAEEHGLHQYANPCSGVHVLVERLLNLNG